MALQLGQAVSDGIRRVFTRTGGILLATLLALQLLVQTSVNTVALGVVPPEATSELEGVLGLTLPVSATVGAVVFAIAFVLSSAYFVVLARALTRPMRHLASFPSTLYTRRMGRATLSMIVSGVLVGLSVLVGTMFLFLPGVFFAVCFSFVIFAVGVEDRRALDALKHSWALSRGNRLKLAVFVIVAGVIGAGIGTVGTIFDLANSPVVGELATNTLSSVLFTLLYGMLAAAYLQVRDGGDRTGGADSPDPIETTAAKSQSASHR